MNRIQVVRICEVLDVASGYVACRMHLDGAVCYTEIRTDAFPEHQRLELAEGRKFSWTVYENGFELRLLPQCTMSVRT